MYVENAIHAVVVCPVVCSGGCPPARAGNSPGRKDGRKRVAASRASHLRARPPANHGPGWQQQVLAKGWGYAIYIPTSVQADNSAGLTEGIIGLVNKGQPRSQDDWGALRAWA